ncbi:MAG: EAL domain-containing protein [Gemmatimonadetes bacterium]|nr:EAL domain-containing protein [Gemmatimonadota bacterium]
MSPANPPESASGLPARGAVASLLGDGPDEALDRIVRLAALALRTPLAVLAIIDDGRLRVKSQVGMPEPWASDPVVPLPHAILRHVLATSKPFVVEDTTRHPLMRDMVLSEEWRRAAYCGVPITLEGRRPVGVLFVLDARPRQWAEREIGFLRDLADSVLVEIDRRLAPEPETPPATAEPAIMAPTNEAQLTVDADWRIRSANARAETLLGRPRPELVGASLLHVFPSLVGSVFHHEYVRAFTDRVQIELEAWCGTLGLWLETRAFPAQDGLAIALRDVSARRNAEEALRQSEARYRAVFQESSDPILFTATDGTIIECNRAAIELFGYTRDELFRMRCQDLIADGEGRTEFFAGLDAGGLTHHALELRGKNGPLHVQASAVARRNADGETIGWQITLRDDRDRRKLEQQMLENAFHDPLTGLANRAVFIDRLERVFMMAQRRPGYRFAVLFIDLDRFKLVNDTFGHMAGDDLLTAVARRLESCLRQEDSVARFGGDEFAILLDNVQDVRDTTRVAERINQELGLPIRVGQREITASASIGIALSDSSHDRADLVLADADTAMYRAKSSGGARYEVFDTEMHLRAVAQLHLEADLQRAVRDREFILHFQPIIAIGSGGIAGFEALLRWRHPERGILHPVEFIDVAEQTGVAADITWMVLRHACTLVQEWRMRAPDTWFDVGMSINVSARTFAHADLLPRIAEILGETGLEPETLRLELTELTLMSDDAQAAETLARLREHGVGICIDNFGLGYSSLRQLQQMPVSALKVDRSFLKTIDRDSGHRGVIESAIALGRSLGVDVIAQGVESLEQLAEVRRLGARYAQGYLLCEPLDADAATDLVLERVQAV